MTVRVRALANFGHKGRNVPKGTVIDLDTEDFGGTYEAFKAAGLIREAPGAALSGGYDPLIHGPSTE